jgi:hypothetical protein
MSLKMTMIGGWPNRETLIPEEERSEGFSFVTSGYRQPVRLDSGGCIILIISIKFQEASDITRSQTAPEVNVSRTHMYIERIAKC